MQGAHAGLEVGQEGGLDVLTVEGAAAGGHGWRGAPGQRGPGVAREGAGRPTEARLAVADAPHTEAGALPVELLRGLVVQSRGARGGEGQPVTRVGGGGSGLPG